MGGHLGSLGSFVLDCSGFQPYQGALPHNSEAWESTLVILAGMGTKGPAVPSLSL